MQTMYTTGAYIQLFLWDKIEACPFRLAINDSIEEELGMLRAGELLVEDLATQRLALWMSKGRGFSEKMIVHTKFENQIDKVRTFQGLSK